MDQGCPSRDRGRYPLSRRLSWTASKMMLPLSLPRASAVVYCLATAFTALPHSGAALAQARADSPPAATS